MRNRFVISSVLLSLTVGYLIYAGFHIISTSAPDFYVYYYAGRDFIHGINPYSDTSLYTLFTYPPVSLVLFSLLALLPVSFAQGLFIFLSSAALLSLPTIILHVLNKKSSYILVSFATVCFIYSFPAKFTLGMGQINAIAFLLLIIGIHFPKKLLISSLIITIACIMKPILAFCLVIYVLRCDWKMLSYISGWSILSIVISYFLAGSNLFIYYFQHVIPHLASVNGRDVYYNQGLLGFISRITLDMHIRSIISICGFIIVFTLACLVCIKKQNFSYQLSILLASLVLIDTLSWQHHFIFLLYPILFIAISSRNIIAMLAVAASYILISMNIATPILYITWPSLLILSHGFYGALIIWCMLIFGE